jgi:bifunctional DNA-binding transcriptional regulator/antitoxin component of YhaV-PrlF toxin-antitoxin module
MSSTTGMATVLSDGHIALPKKMREALGLRKGCRLELTIHRVLHAPEDVEAALLTAVRSPETSVEQLATLVQELTTSLPGLRGYRSCTDAQDETAAPAPSPFETGSRDDNATRKADFRGPGNRGAEVEPVSRCSGASAEMAWH